MVPTAPSGPQPSALSPQPSGVLGGTFDPIHLGHLLAAESAREQLGLARVAFVPVGDPPHKRGRAISPVADRLELVRRAVADHPAFCLSLADVNRPGPHFTVEMLPRVRAELGGTGDLYLILGADQIEDLPTWHRPDLLLERCRIAAVARPGHPLDLAAVSMHLPGLAERTVVVEMPLIGISGTDLRRRARDGRSLRYLVPPAVEAYIAERGLYRA